MTAPSAVLLQSSAPAARNTARDARVRGRRLVAAGALGAVAFLASCNEAAGPLGLPPGSRAFVPELVFRKWWQQVERCANRTAPFDAVTWYLIPGDEPFRVPGHSAPVVGYWDPADNRIVLLEFLPERRAPYVRHEALHAITRRLDHPPEFFETRCGAVINGPENPDE